MIARYFESWSPTLGQLQRFERAAALNMKRGLPGWGDIWLLAANKLAWSVENVE